MDNVKVSKEKINQVCESLGISYLGVFGSQARGDAKKDSDIDLLVRFKENLKLSLFDFIRIEDKLGVFFGNKIDLVSEKSLKNDLKPYVYKDLKTIYGER